MRAHVDLQVVLPCSASFTWLNEPTTNQRLTILSPIIPQKNPWLLTLGIPLLAPDIGTSCSSTSGTSSWCYTKYGI